MQFAGRSGCPEVTGAINYTHAAEKAPSQNRDVMSQFHLMSVEIMYDV